MKLYEARLFHGGLQHINCFYDFPFWHIGMWSSCYTPHQSEIEVNRQKSPNQYVNSIIKRPSIESLRSMCALLLLTIDHNNDYLNISTKMWMKYELLTAIKIIVEKVVPMSPK